MDAPIDVEMINKAFHIHIRIHIDVKPFSLVNKLNMTFSFSES